MNSFERAVDYAEVWILLFIKTYQINSILGPVSNKVIKACTVV